jgi:Outer membrane protein beta-barrel domain
VVFQSQNIGFPGPKQLSAPVGLDELQSRRYPCILFPPPRHLPGTPEHGLPLNMARKSFLPTLVLTAVVPLCALPLRAQDQYSKVELGAQYSTIRESNSNLEHADFSGVGGRFDWNFSRRLALESQVDYFPQQGAPLLLIQGGHTTQAVFGVRAKVVQTRHFSIFGLVRPGLLHFTEVVVPVGAGGSYSTQSANYFVLNLGGGLEYYPTARWILRFDIEGDPYRVPAYASAGLVQPGKINDTTRLSFGVGYRLGPILENESESKVPGNWEFGPLFSAMAIAREDSIYNVRTEPGFGGYASYRFYRVFYLDGDVLYFPQGTTFSGPHDGGAILQALAGLKGGIRRNHFGFFGKVRPGFNSYSDALTGITSTSSGTTNTYARSTNFVLDLGGIVEFYPTERSTLRIEVGDTHILFGDRNVNVDGNIESFPGGALQHSIQLMIGYGWRF